MKHYRLTIFMLTGLLLLSFGCTGDKGEPGMDGISVDAVPPIVSILTPSQLETINADTLHVIARANDNTGIEKVVFYLDGSSLAHDTTVAVDTVGFNDSYESTFDLLDLNVPDGEHSIVARAYDLNGNTKDTAPTLVFTEHDITPGIPYVLKHWTSDSTRLISYPRRIDGVVRDSLLNVRFDVIKACTLDSVRIYLDTIPGENIIYDRNLAIKISRTSTGVYPNDETLTLIDTLKVIPDTLRTPDDPDDIEGPGPFEAGFYTLALTSAQSTEIGTLEEGERFHIAIDFWAGTAKGATATSDVTLIGVGVSVIDRYDFSTENMSGLMNVLTGQWETLQESGIPEIYSPDSYEARIEAWITYE